jgi:ABC-type enterochelin transport system permease subunit
MNLISFSMLQYLGGFFSIGFIVSILIFQTSSQNLGLILLGLFGLVSSLFSYLYKKFELEKTIKITILGLFFASLVSSFSPYIFQFTNNKNLFYASIAYSTVLLLSIFMTKLDISEE